MTQIRNQLLLNSRESLLIRLLYHDAEAPQEQELYAQLVFDDEKQSFLLLLARLAKRNNFAYTPAGLVPRLQGLLRYHGVNSRLTMQPIATLLDRVGAMPVMLYNHCAMYGYYDRENPRIMGTAGVWAAPGRADAIVEAAGFQVEKESSLAALLKCPQGSINLHKIIHPGSDPDIWNRGQHADFQGRPVLVPDCADCLILLLRHELRWQCILPQPTANLKWYFDCACLLRHPQFPGWDALAARAKELGSQETVGLMLSLFDKSIPGWIPAGFLESLSPKPHAQRFHLALNHGAAACRYEAAKSRSLLAKTACWIPWMVTKYHYLNSEISYSDPPVSLGRMLRQHWGLSSLAQLPALFWRRRKKH